jgi:enoyl-CoA hydratase/carnithine racemase
VATLTLARPERLNALYTDLFEQGSAALEGLGDDVRIVIVAAEGRAFSAGADLKELRRPDFSRADGEAFQAAAERFTTLLETIPQATIARVQGLCLTGGLEVALSCDFIIAALDAEFGDTHAKIAFRPRWGLTQRLPRRIGIQRAREMSLTARRVSGSEAAAIGLALDAVPLDQLDARIATLVDGILANDAKSQRVYKALYRESQNHLLDAGLRFETDFRLPRAAKA